jgi:hypothetical protein
VFIARPTKSAFYRADPREKYETYSLLVASRFADEFSLAQTQWSAPELTIARCAQ